MNMTAPADLEGVYDINIYLDQAHYDETRDKRYMVSAYPVGWDGVSRITQTHRPLFEDLPLAIPDGVDIYEAIPDADETWMDSDGEGVPEWVVSQVRALAGEAQ